MVYGVLPSFFAYRASKMIKKPSNMYETNNSTIDSLAAWLMSATCWDKPPSNRPTWCRILIDVRTHGNHGWSVVEPQRPCQDLLETNGHGSNPVPPVNIPIPLKWVVPTPKMLDSNNGSQTRQLADSRKTHTRCHA